MTKLKVTHKNLSDPAFLKKLQELHREAGKQKLSTKLRGSVAAAE